MHCAGCGVRGIGSRWRGCGGRAAGGFAAGDGVVVDAGEELVPVSFCPLEKFEVVLHFAFDESFDGDDAVNRVFGETVCCSFSGWLLWAGTRWKR